MLMLDFGSRLVAFGFLCYLSDQTFFSLPDCIAPVICELITGKPCPFLLVVAIKFATEAMGLVANVFLAPLQDGDPKTATLRTWWSRSSREYWIGCSHERLSQGALARTGSGCTNDSSNDNDDANVPRKRGRGRRKGSTPATPLPATGLPVSNAQGHLEGDGGDSSSSSSSESTQHLVLGSTWYCGLLKRRFNDDPDFVHSPDFESIVSMPMQDSEANATWLRGLVLSHVLSNLSTHPFLTHFMVYFQRAEAVTVCLSLVAQRVFVRLFWSGASEEWANHRNLCAVMDMILLDLIAFDLTALSRLHLKWARESCVAASASRVTHHRRSSSPTKTASDRVAVLEQAFQKKRRDNTNILGVFNVLIPCVVVSYNDHWFVCSMLMDPLVLVACLFVLSCGISRFLFLTLEDGDDDDNNDNNVSRNVEVNTTQHRHVSLTTITTTTTTTTSSSEEDSVSDPEKNGDPCSPQSLPSSTTTRFTKRRFALSARKQQQRQVPAEHSQPRASSINKRHLHQQPSIQTLRVLPSARVVRSC